MDAVSRSNAPFWPRLIRSPWFASCVVVAIFSAAAVALVFGRAAYTGRASYYFLLWNLFLAWIPVVLAFAAVYAYRRGGRWWLVGPLLLAWLLFFPNAPYILTDLMHLRTTRGGPLWLDVLMVVGVALAGLMSGLLSLRAVHSLFDTMLNRTWGWAMTIFTCLASGYGVFLGRFQRWNSWDAVMRPGDLLADAVGQLAAPRALVFTAVLGGFTWLVYLTFAAGGWRRPADDALAPVVSAETEDTPASA